MSDVFEWIFRELLRGIFEFFLHAIWDKMPRPVRIGCNIIGILLIISIVAGIAVVLWQR